MVDEEKEATEVEAKAKAEAETAEKAKLENKGKEEEVPTLDEIIKGDKTPADINKSLEAEAEKINKELDVEEKKKAVNSAEKKEKPAPKAEEDELITPEYRARYKVPDNIKTHKALAEWGPNAEANMKKALAEKDRTAAGLSKTEERLAKMEAAFEEFKKSQQAKVDDGTLTEEERAIENERIRYLWENNPTEAIKQITESIEKKALTKQQKEQEEDAKKQNEEALKEIRGKQAKEWLEIVKEYEDKGDEEKKRFDNEVFPALKKIAEENPGMTSWKTAFKIYKHDLMVAEAARAAEEEAKRKEKEANNSETSHKSADIDSSADGKKLKAINSAATIEELDRAAGIN